jgi:hypothetical protein
MRSRERFGGGVLGIGAVLEDAKRNVACPGQQRSEDLFELLILALSVCHTLA